MSKEQIRAFIEDDRDCAYAALVITSGLLSVTETENGWAAYHKMEAALRALDEDRVGDVVTYLKTRQCDLQAKLERPQLPLERDDMHQRFRATVERKLEAIPALIASIQPTEPSA